MLASVRRDVRCAKERDPAARSTLEVLLAYPGLHAVWAHRLNHRLWLGGHRLVARCGAGVARWLTGIEIHPAARIGQGLFIDHGTGVVIGETAEVGDDVTMYHGVTLGGTTLSKGKRHPTVGHRVTLGAGAKLLGPIEVGDDSRVGANAVVVRSVPPNSVVVGVPGQVIARSRPRPADAPIDLDDALLPDLVGTSLQSLRRRVDELETELHGALQDAEPRPSEAGVWSGEDFSI